MSDLTASDLAGVLDLEELDRDLYRGRNAVEWEGRETLYGGQVAAQALMAAGRTVSDDRLPHSLHGYFLRPGRSDRPVILRVDRDRDGRSLSARRVVAIQNGEVIFSMLSSFAVETASGDYEDPGPEGVAAPDDLPGRGWDRLLEVREVNPRRVEAHKTFHCDRMWVRVADPLPDDPLTHACALTYLSDLGSGFGQVDVPGLPTGGPSIDHAVWFHRRQPLDDWVLLDQWPFKAFRALGLYLGAIRDRDGRLLAVLSQEMRMKAPR